MFMIGVHEGPMIRLYDIFPYFFKGLAFFIQKIGGIKKQEKE